MANLPSSSSLHKLAALATQAILAPDLAAKALMTLDVHPDVLLRLMNYALVPDADVESFDQDGKSYLIQSKMLGGRLWLAPSGKKRLLMPPAPTFSPRSLRALARGLVDTLTAAA